jgi:ABC-type branched-subunit amino acid transport system ATPase component
MRMFAGPNGSGKSTVKNGLPSNLFGNYINPDDLEKTMREDGVIDLASFGITFTTSELQNSLSSSEFLKTHHLADATNVIECRGTTVDFQSLPVNSYYASVFADTLRRKLRSRHICAHGGAA